MIFMFVDSEEERVASMVSTSRANSGAGRRGILTRPTSFTCAETEYMP